jgi:hypothetical protein
VAVVDQGFDLLHPALQFAISSSGKLIPKFADIGTLTSPDEDSGWVRFSDPIQTQNRRFHAAGRTWTVKDNGTYRFGVFKQDLVLGSQGNSLSKRLSLSVGVIWDRRHSRVWVDTDGDGSFANERSLGDYGVTFCIAWFGAKRHLEDNRIPFAVKIDDAKNSVYIRIGGYHGTLVAGPLAANTITGGLFNGAAPGAQLIDEDVGRKSRIAAIVKMAARPDVDLINHSGGIGRAGFSGVHEGREDFAQHVLERVIKVYDKPIVSYTAAPGAIHVNDYSSSEMLRRNRQLAPPYRDTINSFVWSVPSGLVNTVLAPSTNLVTQSRYKPVDIVWPDGKRHALRDEIFDPPAPDGYGIGDNNSPTIPIVSGVLADLISEAKREHVHYNATRLNDAIYTGTRLLEGFPLSQQGYGLINATRSWIQLTTMANADDPNNPNLTSFSVSRSEGGRQVQVNGFHSESLEFGKRMTGEIWITRHGGYAGSRLYTFSLRGNDGSYELIDQSANLKRDKAERIRFITNGSSGLHVAFLELRDVGAGVAMKDIPLSMLVPEVPQNIAPGVDRYESTILPLRSDYRYVDVGTEAQATRYIMTIHFTGTPICCSARIFPGFHYVGNGQDSSGPIDSIHHVGPLETLESLIANDQPSTKQIFWDNRGLSEYATPYDGPAPDVPIHAALTV